MQKWLGVALGLMLVVAWVVVHLVIKVTSMAVHLLLLGAVVFIAMNVFNRIRQRVGPGS
ncbi:MAG: hypothetical protein JWN48_4285 [Myxococcaceae bacterium]|nr:hypothetical protein [Myxococcaceae bacterium]